MTHTILDGSKMSRSPMTHSHSDAHLHATTADLRIAFFLNLGFTLVAGVGGIWTNSVAILSDAVHDFGDSLSLGLAWYLDRYAQRERDQRFSYGYRRFSLLGAVTTTIALVIGSVFVLIEAVPRLFSPEPTNPAGMVIFALLGVTINGIAALRLRGRKSINARIVAWHLLEDVLGWTAVLIAAVTLLFVNLPLLDPTLSILITFFVLYNVIRNFRNTTLLFLQAVPDDVNLSELKQRLVAIDQICSVHHTHVWSMDGEHHVLTTHVVVDPSTTREGVQSLRADVEHLCAEFHFAHTTIEVEWGDDDCRMSETHNETAS